VSEKVWEFIEDPLRVCGAIWMVFGAASIIVGILTLTGVIGHS
jgi:hypothetical protein